ncbi:MAG: hypothetical protein HJJLKODD_01123 [Phycisphaerae bacterium]|nr:hypothetical protein [Phycisphaerae bacterium]
MSMDKSLKSAGALHKHNNVLSRAERIAILEDEGRFEDGKNSVFGLPKVGHRKMRVGGKTKKTEETATTDVAAPAAAAPAAKAEAAKAPAKGGKA